MWYFLYNIFFFLSLNDNLKHTYQIMKLLIMTQTPLHCTLITLNYIIFLIFLICTIQELLKIFLQVSNCEDSKQVKNTFKIYRTFNVCIKCIIKKCKTYFRYSKRWNASIVNSSIIINMQKGWKQRQKGDT